MKKKILIYGVVVVGIVVLVLWWGYSMRGEGNEASEQMSDSSDRSEPSQDEKENALAANEKTSEEGNDEKQKLWQSQYVAMSFDDPHVFVGNHIVEKLLAASGLQIVDELKEVRYCGGIYQTKQIIIDGVEVVERISYLLNQQPEIQEWYCGIIRSRADGERKERESIKEGEELYIVISNFGTKTERHPIFYQLVISLAKNSPSGLAIGVTPETNSISVAVLDGPFLGTLRSSEK